MTLPEYLGLFRRRWLVVVAGILVGLAVAAAFLALTPRKYSASTTLYVSARSAAADSVTSAYDGNLLAEERVKSYIPLVTSSTVNQNVAAALNVNTAPADLADKVTASSQPNTVLLYITATDPSPAFATRLANAYGDAFVRWTTQLEQAPDATHPPVVFVQVATPATLPTAPSSPVTSLYLGAGVALGLALGVAAALLLEAFDTFVKSFEHIQEATGGPGLAMLTSDRPSALPVLVRGRSRQAEEFRQLRTRLAFTGTGGRPPVIALASALHGEGTTYAVCNLAVAFAEAGSRVLVIDANLPEPMVGRYFGLDHEAGLSDVLTGASPTGQSVQTWRGNGLLDVLTSGSAPVNSSELLGSVMMVELLEEARSTYDVVLIDLPPLLRVSDGAALAPHVDGVVLVVRYGKTARKFVKAAAETVSGVSGRLLGTVLTMVPVAVSRAHTPSFGEYGDESAQDNEPVDWEGLRRARAAESLPAGALGHNGRTPGSTSVPPPGGDRPPVR